MHAGVVRRADGDVLRLWEWERTRDLVLQVDLSLPEGSDRLYASTRVVNPDPEDKPLYWWTDGARVAVIAYGAPGRTIAAQVRARGGQPVMLGARWFIAQARRQKALWESAP